MLFVTTQCHTLSLHYNYLSNEMDTCFKVDIRHILKRQCNVVNLQELHYAKNKLLSRATAIVAIGPRLIGNLT